MISKAQLQEELKAVYGIASYDELVKEIKALGPVDISLFVTGGRKEMCKGENSDLERVGESKKVG